MDVHLLNGSELSRMLLRCDTAAGTCVSHDIPMVGAHTVRMGEVHALKHLWAAMRSGHLSVLEHCTLTFAIEGISRACSHQLVRHRLMSVEQQSQRFVGMKSFSYVTPPSIEALQTDRRAWADSYGDWLAPRNAFSNAMDVLADTYNALVEAGVPEEDARYILPNACCTNLVVTMNLREFIHFCGLRRCSRSQWEIRELAERMAEEVSEHVPWLAPWFMPQCILLGYCPEQRSCGRVPRRKELVDAIPDEMEKCPQVRLFPTTNGGIEWYD